MTAVEFREIIAPLAGDPLADGFEDRLEGYHARCRGTLTTLLQYLPRAAEAVLDVGCGMGGLGLLLADHYRWENTPIRDVPFLVRLGLLDGSDSVRNIAGHRPIGYQPFSEHNRPWNDATLPADRFRQFGFDARALTPADDDWEPQDVIVSTRSWGFHYPVDAYLHRARHAVKPGGIVALEIRHGTDGAAKMQAHFRLVGEEPAIGSTKCGMYVFRRT